MLPDLGGTPAPLYCVLVNHGDRDPEQFHLYAPGIDPNETVLSPMELNTMVDNLELSLIADDLASQEPLTFVLGMCFSGGFIDELSGDGRIIISAAAPQVGGGCL